MKRLAALALFCGILALNPGTAQERKREAPPPTPVPKQRAVYPVQYGDSVALAEVVGRHFNGEADVIAAPAASGNVILISGPVTAEVVKMLDQLDRKPRSVEVEVTLAELPAAKDGKELSPADLVTAALKDAKGQRIRLTAVDGQQVTTQSGGNKPVVTGAVAGGANPPRPGGFGGPGVMQKSISYQQVGTTLKMTPRIGADNAVTLELSVQDSRVRAPEAGDEAGASSMENNSLTTKLNIAAGRSVVAQAVRTETKTGAVVAVVVVTARVVDEKSASARPER